MILLVLGTAGLGRAQDDPPPAGPDRIVVTGERVETNVPREDFTAFATVLDTRGAPRELTTLTDVLSESVGVQVRRFGGLGAFSTLSVRGFSPGQVQIYLDGVPLTRADNETVNLADLPMDAVERIEVYRGMTPLGFPQSGPGGVVNIITRAPDDAPVLAASASYGSFDTRKATVVHGASVDAWDYLVFASYLGSEGDFDFTDDRGTDDNPRDDREVERINNDFDSGSLVVRARRSLGDRGELTVTTDTFAKEEGVPGRDAPQSEHARRRIIRQLTSIDGTLRLAAPMPIDLRTGAWVAYRREDFEVPFPDPAFAVPRDATNESVVVGGQLLARTVASRHHAPGAIVAMAYERFDESDDVGAFPAAEPGDAPTRTRLHLTLGADDEIALLDGRVLLVPSLRWEYFRDDFPGDPRVLDSFDASGTETHDFVAPRLGTRAELIEGVTLFGNVGRWERVPNLRELFGTAGLVVGDPTLDPERSFNWDVGLRAELPAMGILPGGLLEYAYFESDLDDVILLEPSSTNVFRPRNVASAHVEGHEVAARVRVTPRLHVHGNYTYQDARDDGEDVAFFDGNQLPGRPRHEAFGRVQFAWRQEEAWWPVPSGHVFYEVNFIAENFLDRANTERVDSRLLHGVGLQLDLGFDVRLAVEVRNVADEQTRDVADFPLPGRTVFGTLSWGFGGSASELP